MARTKQSIRKRSTATKKKKAKRGAKR